MKRLVLNSKVLLKQDKEYLMNGVYYFNRELFMSIWAYKTKHGFDKAKNTTTINSDDSSRMPSTARAITITPDFGYHKEVLAFKPEDIEELLGGPEELF